MGVAALELYLVDDAVDVPVEDLDSFSLKEPPLHSLARARQSEHQSAGLRVLRVRLRRQLLSREGGLLLPDPLLLLLDQRLGLSVVLLLLLLEQVGLVFAVYLLLPLALLGLLKGVQVLGLLQLLPLPLLKETGLVLDRRRREAREGCCPEG